jgi:hypothetical protein
VIRPGRDSNADEGERGCDVRNEPTGRVGRKAAQRYRTWMRENGPDAQVSTVIEQVGAW